MTGVKNVGKRYERFMYQAYKQLKKEVSIRSGDHFCHYKINVKNKVLYKRGKIILNRILTGVI